jgi:hypothetical protein
MKRKNRRYFIIGLIAFILVLAGVYAIFTTALNISGTATGTANFKIEFTDATISDVSKANYDISTDGTTLTINTNLSYPGDSATINFTIKNTGTLAARVDKLTITNNNSADFTVQIVGLSNIEGTVLPVNGTTNGSIVATWNTSSTNQNPTDVTFGVTIDYSQSTT